MNPAYSSLDGVLFNKDQTILIKFPPGKAGYYTIPTTVTSIKSYAFSDCDVLTEVTIGNGVTSIGFSTFSGCTGMTSIIIPDSVTSIRSFAFSGCTGLTNIIIPDSITHIESGTFSGCTGLTNVTIGNGVTSIDTYVFSGCTGLLEIMVEVPNPAYSSLDGVLFNKAQTELILCPSAKAGLYTIPKDAISIWSYAFSDCTNLTGIVIPKSVISIEYESFSGCTGLLGITVDPLNPAYSSFDEVLFNKEQTELILFPSAKAESYIVPDSVTSIRPGAFRDSTILTRIIIPDSLTSIWSYAFDSCPILTGVYFRGDAPVLLGDGGLSYDGNATVYYIPGTVGWGATFGGLPTAIWVSPVDVDLNYGVDLSDFVVLSSQWGQTDCNDSNDWCQWADFDQSGEVDPNDLNLLTEDWMFGIVPD